MYLHFSHLLFKNKNATIKFGTNVDLSEAAKWAFQLSELQKLPGFLRIECPEENLLNHLGQVVRGVNKAQLYMKVPGCRTPAHQENMNLCSVNLNSGPGNVEWLGTARQYWVCCTASASSKYT